MTFTEEQLSERQKINIKKLVKEVQETLQKAHAMQIKYYDRWMRIFEVGDHGRNACFLNKKL